DALACMHQLEALVDVLEPERVGHHRVDLDLAVHVPVDDARHIGAALGATKGGTHPAAAGDELEGTGGDFLAGTGHPDHHRLAPAAMAGLKRLAHDFGVAGAVEGVVGAPDLIDAALGHIDQMDDDIALDLGRVDEVGHAEALAPRLLAVVDVDADDHVGPGKAQPLDHVEADAAETEYHGSRPDLD